MKTFVTADLHLNHGNIIRYCNRPFDNLAEMNYRIVSIWNKTVSEGDTVFHIGDFCYRREVDGEYQGINYWRRKLNGNIIFIAGTHDKQLAIKTLTIYFGGKAILMQHDPIYSIQDIPTGIEYVLCGHVHNKWQNKTVGDVKVINVGIDVSDFKPNQLAEVVKQDGNRNEYEGL